MYQCSTYCKIKHIYKYKYRLRFILFAPSDLGEIGRWPEPRGTGLLESEGSHFHRSSKGSITDVRGGKTGKIRYEHDDISWYIKLKNGVTMFHNLHYDSAIILAQSSKVPKLTRLRKTSIVFCMFKPWYRTLDVGDAWSKYFRYPLQLQITAVASLPTLLLPEPFRFSNLRKHLGALCGD